MTAAAIAADLLARLEQHETFLARWEADNAALARAARRHRVANGGTAEGTVRIAVTAAELRTLCAAVLDEESAW